MHSGRRIHSMIVVMFYMYRRRLARETGQLSTLKERPSDILCEVWSGERVHHDEAFCSRRAFLCASHQNEERVCGMQKRRTHRTNQRVLRVTAELAGEHTG